MGRYLVLGGRFVLVLLLLLRVHQKSDQVQHVRAASVGGVYCHAGSTGFRWFFQQDTEQARGAEAANGEDRSPLLK